MFVKVNLVQSSQSKYLSVLQLTYRLILGLLSVRMAEWSKAPDSRSNPLKRVFWSTNVGVGSNPTSDTSFVYD